MSPLRHTSESGIVEARLRGILCSLAILVYLITPVELILLDHVHEWQQLIPFVAAFFGLVTAGWVLVDPTRSRILAARAVSVAIAVVTVIGVGLHFQANLELELEIRPGTTFGDVWVEAAFGAAPLLASGILLLGALMILGATYAHPAARQGAG